jgi:hypothetical protein
MKKMILFFLISTLFSHLLAEDKPVREVKEATVGNKKIIYTYKQFEKFDFDDLNSEGASGAPNDISITPGHEPPYSNRLPYRKSFTVEIKKGIERVR